MAKKIAVVHVQDESAMGVSEFKDTYGDFMSKLEQVPGFTVELVKKMDDLKRLIEQDCPDVIIFGDEVLTDTKYGDFVLTGIKPFMESGGLVLFALGCLNLSVPPDFARLMERLGLHWKHSESYKRTDFQLTSAGKALFPNFPENCNVNAVPLSNVLTEHRIYQPVPGAKTHSFIPYLHGVPSDPNLAMVAFARIGAGGLGTVGEAGYGDSVTNDITIGMCSVQLN